MRYCGIDVSAKPANQQLVTLRERGDRLAATFHAPATVDAVVAAVLAGGDDAVVAIDAPAGRRLDLLAPGAPLRAPLGLPAGRYHRMRVCDAVLYRRGLPLYPVPSAAEALTPWQAWMEVGFTLFAGLERAIPRFRPPAGERAEGRVQPGAHGRLAETFPDAVFCALLGHRPPPKRTAAGRRARIAALAARRVDAIDGLQRRTHDELDACAAALAARALATGPGCWVGDPREGVVVLPVDGLAPRYRRPPAPAPSDRGRSGMLVIP